MKYLIEIHHGIGDIVHMTGVIESLFAYDKKAEIGLILNKEEYKDLFRFSSKIKYFYRIDLKCMSKYSLLREVVKMRNEKFDYFLISRISNKRASFFLSLLVNAKISIGEQLPNINGRMVNVEKLDIHDVERNNNLVKKIDPNIILKKPYISVNTKEVQTNFKKPALALCVGASIPQKIWNIDNYLYLADFFYNNGYDIVLIGGKKEKELIKGKKINNNFFNYIGKLSIIESACVLSKCLMALGTDTGMMHIAAACGIKTLTLFSCSNPSLHRPYSETSYVYSLGLDCQYCYEKGTLCVHERYKCIDDIRKEEIKKYIIKIINSI